MTDRFKSSQYPTLYLDSYSVKRINNLIVIKFVSEKKRTIRFGIDKLDQITTFFREFMDKHKVDVCIYKKLLINDNLDYYLEFGWSAYNDWLLDDNGADISDKLRLVHKNDIYSFHLSDETIDNIIILLENIDK